MIFLEIKILIKILWQCFKENLQRISLARYPVKLVCLEIFTSYPYNLKINCIFLEPKKATTIPEMWNQVVCIDTVILLIFNKLFTVAIFIYLFIYQFLCSIFIHTYLRCFHRFFCAKRLLVKKKLNNEQWSKCCFFVLFFSISIFLRFNLKIHEKLVFFSSFGPNHFWSLHMKNFWSFQKVYYEIFSTWPVSTVTYNTKVRQNLYLKIPRDNVLKWSNWS